MSRSIFALTRDGVSLIVDVSTGTPVIAHWGAALGSRAAEDISEIGNDGRPQSGYDDPRPAGIWRENARGFLGAPAVVGHRNGYDWTPLFEISDTVATEFRSADNASDHPGGSLVCRLIHQE